MAAGGATASVVAFEREQARVDRHPTEPQKAAGNYSKGHVKLHGLDVSIETPAGGLRSGIAPDGTPWSVALPYAYGYIRRTVGADGDQVDVCIGPDLKSDKVFIVDQHNADSGRFDEHKILLGYTHRGDAEMAYDGGFSDGRGPERRRAVIATDIEGLKRWLKNGALDKPAASQTLEKTWDPQKHPRDNFGRFAAAAAAATVGAVGATVGAAEANRLLRTRHIRDYRDVLRREKGAGRKIVFRGAPEADSQPKNRAYNSIYVAENRGIAGKYAARDVEPTMDKHARLRLGNQVVNRYSLPADEPLLHINTFEAKTLEDEFRLPKNDERTERILSGAHRLRNLRGKYSIVGHDSRREASRLADLPEPSRSERLGLEATFFHTHPSKRDTRFLSRLGYSGSRNQWGNIALHDASHLRFLGAADKTQSLAEKVGRTARAAVNEAVLMLAHKSFSDATDLLAKAAKKKANDEIASGVETPLASGIAAALTWAQTTGANAVAAAAQKTRDIADIVSAFPSDEFEKKLSAALDPLESAFEGGVENGAARIPREIRVNFDMRNPQVTRFLATYKMDLIRQISDEQKDTINGIVTRAVAAGQPPAQMARLIRSQAGIGLTDTQAQNVANYADALRNLDVPGNIENALGRALRDRRYDGTIQNAADSGMALSDEQINAMVNAYRRRYVAYRAMTIARTESMKATNLGTVAAAQQVADQGGYRVIKKWMATHDNRTRETHRELDGQTVEGMETPFVLPDGRQIRYPHDPDADADLTINCRCVLSTHYLPGSGSDADAVDLTNLE